MSIHIRLNCRNRESRFVYAGVLSCARYRRDSILLLLLALTFVVTLAMPLDIDVVVPVVRHEVDWLTASVVLGAMLAPVFRVARWYVQVERLRHHTHRHRLDHDWLRVDKLRLRKVANINPAIIAGVADSDRNSDIGGERVASCCCDNRPEYKSSHREPPLVVTPI